MKGCAVTGGCPSDYVAFSISAFSLLLLLARSALPFLCFRLSIPKGSTFWIPALQILASFNLLVSVVMSVNLIKIERRHWWHSCYIWAVWVEGPFGFGLLLSCRVVQVYHLFFIFVKKRLPPVRSHIFLPLLLLPWVAVAAVAHDICYQGSIGKNLFGSFITNKVINLKKPLNQICQMSALWVTSLAVLHSLYVVIFFGLTRSIHHVDFRFNELKDLWRGVLVSTFSVVFWVVAYVLNKIHEDVEWIRLASRFLLALTTSILILALFSYSSSQPLLSQISLRRKECLRFESMGQALGIADYGIQQQRQSVTAHRNEPLDKLLLDKKFRQSFMAYADSCLAGESVHFYEEVLELGELPTDDSVRRIYMARHIIQKYIVAGAPMEVNISHRTRQQILNSADLAHPNLFKIAIYELLQLIKTNLARDYWLSTFYMKYKQEADSKMNGHDLELAMTWNVTPRLSCVHAADDPFHQDNLLKGSDVMPLQ